MHHLMQAKLCNTFLASMDEVLRILGNSSNESGPGEVTTSKF